MTGSHYCPVSRACGIGGTPFDVGGREAWTFNQLVDAVLVVRGLQQR